MNTYSIVALIVIAICVIYIAYCIIGAARLSRRNRMTQPHEEPHDATGDNATTDENSSEHTNTIQ